ncbi:short-chain dehydrogenase [Candidatus Atribacteria bacterium RBG_19FT_COMBO_35_14]|uniref:Short-chain dehydrogenase n=1 Tax=Candidatus Sediminicultor quintus TaxID=1797291 RepID=A0A1F5ADQ2_9BACT|nr:MAG: short-chain dehydrogenase [Candidatus Atribacteria bacterium RBG_19FT_COMBO_35_14]
MNLVDKVAIVTGAGRGIGKAIAIALAREGANVIVNDIDIQTAEEVVKEIKSLGWKALAIRVDVSDSKEVNQMVQLALKKFKRVDILVNNAAIIKRGSIEDLTEEDWDKVIDVNLKGAFNCMKAVVGIMKKQRYGKIVNISSIAGKIGDLASAPCYGASKAGMICLAKSLARELAAYNINVNVVAPHAIKTDMSKEWSEEKRKNIVANIPLGRMGEPEDIAEAVAFLVSDKAKFITGEVLDVNGGYLMD